MTDMQENRGVTPTEQLLAKLCSQSFLRLWSHANPYKDDGHEFCDVLAIFEKHIFIFFDRHKNLPPLHETDNPLVNWDRWKRRAIEDQIKTAHGAERYIRNGRALFLDAKKQKPFPIPFKISDAIIHKIIVAHGAAEACKSFSDENISGSLTIGYSDRNIEMPLPFMVGLDKSKPIHVLDSNTLPIILGELDTVRDFANYLDAKFDAIRKYDTLLYCGEEDLLADYWLNIDKNNNHYIGTTDESINNIMIAEGAWESLKKRPEYSATKKANKRSYFWDDLINRTCENYIQGLLLGNSNLLEGRSAIREMAKEPRFIRREIVELMFGAIAQFPNDAKELTRLMRYIPSYEKGKGYVFLQIYVPPEIKHRNKDEREIRQEILMIACGAARNHMPDLHTVIGIGVEPPKLVDDIGEDFVLLDCSEWSKERSDEFKEKNRALNFFNSPTLRRYEQQATELVKSSPDHSTVGKILKTGRNEPCPCGSGKKFKKCHGLRI